MRAGRIHQRAASDPSALGEAHGGDPAFASLDADDLVLPIFRAERARLAPERLQEPVGVGPAFVLQAEAAARETLGVEPGEPLAQTGFVEQGDLGSRGALQLMVPAQDGHPGRCGEEQIALLDERDLDGFALHREVLARRPDELHAEHGHRDVLRRGELLADAASGARGRGVGVGQILLHHQDRAGKADPTLEEIGDGAANDAPARDHDVVLGRHALYLIACGRTPFTILHRARASNRCCRGRHL
jgi:hypothetical protein